MHGVAVLEAGKGGFGVSENCRHGFVSLSCTWPRAVSLPNIRMLPELHSGAFSCTWCLLQNCSRLVDSSVWLSELLTLRCGFLVFCVDTLLGTSLSATFFSMVSRNASGVGPSGSACSACKVSFMYSSHSCAEDLYLAWRLKDSAFKP